MNRGNLELKYINLTILTSKKSALLLPSLRDISSLFGGPYLILPPTWFPNWQFSHVRPRPLQDGDLESNCPSALRGNVKELTPQDKESTCAGEVHLIHLSMVIKPLKSPGGPWMQANCESSALTVALAYIGTRHLGEEKNCLMVMVLRKSESHPPQKVKNNCTSLGSTMVRWACYNSSGSSYVTVNSGPSGTLEQDFEDGATVEVNGRANDGF